MSRLHGVERDANGAVSMTASGTIVFLNAIPLTSIGELRTTTITGAPPAGSKIVGGLSYASDGSIQVTTDAIGKVINGIAYTALNVLCITTNAPANTSTRAFLSGIGSVLVDTTGRVHVS